MSTAVTCEVCRRAGAAFVFADADALARHEAKRHPELLRAKR